MKPLLSLVMIVRDESRSIRAVLEAAKPHVDHYTILDTGSTDGTQAIVREVMAGVPGSLYEEPFANCAHLGHSEIIDYAATRNRALDLDYRPPLPPSSPPPPPPSTERLEGRSAFLTAEEILAFSRSHAEFQLMLSGDEYLRNGEALRKHLEAHRESKVDCHFVRVLIDGITLHRPIVLRSGSAWRYEGEVHEVPCNRVNESAPLEAVPDACVEHVVSDPERRLNAIWERHIPVLEAKLARDPQDVRSLVFLAQSYDRFLPLMEGEERIKYARKSVELYARRMLLPFVTNEERGYVQMRMIDVMRFSSDYTDAQLLERAEAIRETEPNRPEVALLCAVLAQKVRPLIDVYNLANRAGQVAAAAIQGQIVSTSPVDFSCCWRAHYLAAAAARQLAKNQPADFGPIVQKHVAAGIEVGGPPSIFEPLLAGVA